MARVKLGASEVIEGADRLEGDPRAAWKVVEYMDYDCPPCALVAMNAHRILHAYGNRVAWYVCQCPLPTVHPNAEELSRLAIVARRHGELVSAHEWLFAHQFFPIEQKRAALASISRISELQIRSESEGKDVVGELRREEAQCRKLDVQATPTIFLIGPDQSVYRASNVEQLVTTLARI